MSGRRLVAVVGATASGKSALALELALRLGGEIVNADSRQVYRGMDIGTAKPSRDERAIVPHHLFDIADPGEGYSLALFQRDARAACEGIWSRGHMPVLVGGTGQYVWGFLEGWTVPEVPPDEEFRAALRAFADEHGANALHARLADADPVAAGRIDARNVRRVVRALEVLRLTGRPMSDWQTKTGVDFEYAVVAPDVPREEVDRRIEARTRQMFAAGFVDEVQGLLDAGIPSDAPAMSSIGYPEVLQALAGELSVDEAAASMSRATRRLARRQAQWFRRIDERIAWVRDVEEALAAVRAMLTAPSTPPGAASLPPRGRPAS